MPAVSNETLCIAGSAGDGRLSINPDLIPIRERTSHRILDTCSADSLTNGTSTLRAYAFRTLIRAGDRAPGFTRAARICCKKVSHREALADSGKEIPLCPPSLPPYRSWHNRGGGVPAGLTRRSIAESLMYAPTL